MDGPRIDCVTKRRQLVRKMAGKAALEVVEGRQRIAVERFESRQKSIELGQRALRASVRLVALQRRRLDDVTQCA